MIDDLRFALRGLWNAKGFAAVAVVCLGLGIGGTTAIFSVMKTVLWDPLPYPSPEQLISIDNGGDPWSLPLADVVMEDQTSFTEIGGIRSMRYNVANEGEILELDGAQITPGFLPALGVAPVAGRVFESEDDRADAKPVALLAEQTAVQLFETPAGALGESVWVDGVAHEVVGVLPDSGIVDNHRIFVPPGVGRSSFPLNHPGAQRFRLVGRLASGATASSAKAELELASPRIREAWPDQFPDSHRFRFGLESLESSLVGDTGTLMWFLMGSVLSVLLIACANVANLLLTRATVRARETAVRRAIGATALGLVRQQVIEGLVLALAGAAAGLLVASWGVHLIGREAIDIIPMIAAAELDLGVLAFTLTISVVSALGFSLVPALSSLDVPLTQPLKAGGLGWRPRGRRLTQGWIVSIEVALALLLLVGAGLSLRSVQQLRGFDVGFDPEQATAAALSLPEDRYPTPESRTALGQELVQWAAQQPGVQSVALSDQLPLLPASSVNTTPITRDLSATPMNSLPRTASITSAEFSIGPGFDQAIGLRLIRGRFFEPDDAVTGGVTVIDQVVANRLFPDVDPVGSQMRTRGGIETIVGVVAPVRIRGVSVEGQFGAIFRPSQSPWNRSGAGILVRTSQDPRHLAAKLRAKALELDPGLPAFSVEPYAEAIDSRIARQRLLVSLLALFAAVAAIIAGIGIYGLMRYAVAQRTHEIGIRTALGAPARLVTWLILGDALRPVLTGIAVGLLAAGLASRAIESLVYGVDPLDPLAFVAAVVGIVLVSLIAAYLPTRRAVRLSPNAALRQE